jgi:hypothetical protein
MVFLELLRRVSFLTLGAGTGLYLASRSLGEPFPWEFLAGGISMSTGLLIEQAWTRYRNRNQIIVTEVPK